MARPDFRAAAARRLSEDRELSPAIVSLLSSENAGRSTGVKVVAVDRIESNPDQPRMVFDADALNELAASIREHGVLQPILVRPLGDNRYQLDRRRAPLAGVEGSRPRRRSRRSSRTSTTTRPSRSRSSRTSSARTSRRSRKRRCSTG